MFSCSKGAPSATCGGADWVEPVFRIEATWRRSARLDLDGAVADRLRRRRVEAAEQPQHAEAGAKPLFRVRPARQHRQDQRLGAGADVACLAGEPVLGPFGIPSVRTGSMWSGSVPCRGPP